MPGKCSFPLVAPPASALLPVASAALLAGSCYPLELNRLVWIALVPLLVWLARPSLSSPRAFLGLFAVGAFYHAFLLMPLLSLTWWGWGLATAAFFSYQRLFLLVLASVLSAWGGIVVALVGLGIRWQLHRPTLALWWVPAVWVIGLEFLGHGSVLGFTWGLLGNRLHDAVYLRQLASLTGVYGLSFLIVLVNTAIALTLVQLMAHSRPGPTRTVRAIAKAVLAPPIRRVLLLTGAFVLGTLLYGAACLRAPASAAPALSVALLQGGGEALRSGVATDEGLDRIYERLWALVPSADLVVLPETVWRRTLRLDGTSSPWELSALDVAQMSRLLDATFGKPSGVVVFGIDAVQEDQIYNAMVYWSAGRVLGTYFKRRLVPFAEYAPRLVGRLAPPNRLHGPGFVYRRGTGSQLVRLNGVLAGSFICQEVMLPELVRGSVRDGAQLLITTGNDGMFASRIVALEQANLAKLRAVENRRFLLRAMKSGVTAVVDPWGRELARTPRKTPAVVGSNVHPRRDLTLYTRWGDWILWVCGMIVLTGLMPAAGPRRPPPR